VKYCGSLLLEASSLESLLIGGVYSLIADGLGRRHLCMPKNEKSKLNEEDKKLTNEQTYDSALASMVSKLKNYVVPLVNEVFGEQFTKDADVALQNNKHVLQRTDNALDRRDSDLVVELYSFSKRCRKLRAFEKVFSTISFNI